MRYNKYHWILLAVFLLVICLFASAEKKVADEIGVTNAAFKDNPNSLPSTNNLVLEAKTFSGVQRVHWAFK